MRGVVEHDRGMTISARGARARLFRLIEQAARTREPIRIAGRRGNAVLVSEEDWRAIQETLHLLSMPGMRGSIRKGMREPVSRLRNRLGW